MLPTFGRKLDSSEADCCTMVTALPAWEVSQAALLLATMNRLRPDQLCGHAGDGDDDSHRLSVSHEHNEGEPAGNASNSGIQKAADSSANV